MSFSPGKTTQGYRRIPQLMVPWIISTMDQWLQAACQARQLPLRPVRKRKSWVSPTSNASKPITRDELIQCCDPTLKTLMEFPNPDEALVGRRQLLCAGVDWGEGNDGSEKSPSGKVRVASYTVLTIGAYVNQHQYKIVFVKKYVGQQVDPDFVVRDIARICQLYDVKLCAVDWGHGWGVNNPPGPSPWSAARGCSSSICRSRRSA